MEKNSRRKRFEKVAGNRVNRLIRTLSSLSKCANRNNYEYDESDVRKMIKVLRDKLNDVETEFSGQLSKQNKSEFKF